MSRSQFSVKKLLWLTAVVAAFLGGVETQRYGDAEKLAEYEKEFAINDQMQRKNGQVWDLALKLGWQIEFLKRDIDNLKTMQDVDDLKDRLKTKQE